MYQNTAYWTSIEPNRLMVWPPRKAPTLRRQWGMAGGVGSSAAGTPASEGWVTPSGYRPSLAGWSTNSERSHELRHDHDEARDRAEREQPAVGEDEVPRR